MLVAAVAAPPLTTSVLMPTISPAPLTSGPPELPDEIAASVWMSPSSAPLSDHHGAVECRHDAERDRWLTVEVEREADRHHLVADADRARVRRSVPPGSRCRRSAAARGRCRRRWRAAAPRVAPSRPPTGPGLRRIDDDVCVGDDLAVRRGDDAGADRLRGAVTVADVGADRDDRGPDRLRHRGDVDAGEVAAACRDVDRLT